MPSGEGEEEVGRLVWHHFSRTSVQVFFHQMTVCREGGREERVSRFCGVKWLDFAACTYNCDVLRGFSEVQTGWTVSMFRFTQ